MGMDWLAGEYKRSCDDGTFHAISGILIVILAINIFIRYNFVSKKNCCLEIPMRYI